MSRKNKTLRAWKHQNPDGTLQQAWDAAWKAQGSRAYSLVIKELRDLNSQRTQDVLNRDKQIKELKTRWESAREYIKELKANIIEIEKVSDFNATCVESLSDRLEAVKNCDLKTAFDISGNVEEAYFSVNDVLKVLGQ